MAILEMAKPPCHLYLPGTVPYEACWKWQQQLVASRKANPQMADALILVEHPSVYTLGQGADRAFLKFDLHDPPAAVFHVERGGEVTYHTPGQIVGYPILNLHRYRLDLHWYLRQLESVVIEVLANLDLHGERIPGLTGVWVKDRKVAAIGIKASRWITMHGFALNVCPDLSGFDQIIPCGIADKGVGRLVDAIPTLDTATVYPLVQQAFAQVFQVELVLQSVPDLDALTSFF